MKNSRLLATLASFSVVVALFLPPARAAEPGTRTEKDLLGEKQVPADAYYGVQTARALENFQISGVAINHYPGFVEAWAIVKLAAARANTAVGAMKPEKLAAIEKACDAVLKGKYPTQIRWVFKDFPLSFHQRAMPAALAARCAGDQGKYWEYHEKLFSGKGLQDDDLKGYAKEIGLDENKFGECLAGKRFQAGVDADMKLGQSVGVSGTPAFFINGRMLSGAQPPEAFVEIIEEELSRKNPS